jgi:hypothetical protein
LLALPSSQNEAQSNETGGKEGAAYDNANTNASSGALESWPADEGLFEFVGRGVPLAPLAPCIIRLRDVDVAVPVAGGFDVMVCVLTAPACARRSSRSVSSRVTGFHIISDPLRSQEELALLFDM